MWNDEDNNPYGTSFDGREPAPGNQIPTTEEDTNYLAFSTTRQEYPHEDEESDSDEDYLNQQGKSSPKSYESRILQILHENPDLPIQITDAGKSLESGGKYIVYTIRTGDLEVRRRYSEFNSLRDALCRLHPTLIIPPIPEKHTMADYAANPTKAKQDQQIIDLRKRMLTVFLNRCRRMKQVFNDGVWWRFLDPNASWSEVLHSPPISSIPKSNMKAPPLNPANPTPAHAFLPVPASSARLKSGSRSSTISQSAFNDHSEATSAQAPNKRSATVPGGLKEADLEAYLANFEAKIEKLEGILTGPIEKVNRRTLQHLNALSSDLAELGARFNGFSLSEQSPSLAAAIERVGQAVDSSYIAGEELSSSLAASFAEPMRESAQFAGVVRGVLRFRILKRVQQEMTADELAKKRALLESLERSESEAKRIESYLNSSGGTPRRSTSSARDNSHQHRRDGSHDDTASIDSDFPPTHGDTHSTPSATQGTPEIEPPSTHRKSGSGNFITNRIFGSFRHAVNGVVDVDPERTRRDQMGKTRESIQQLEQAQQVSEQDVKDANNGVYADLVRFQAEKEDDLKRYMVAYAKAQIEWAKKNRETWMEAKSEISKIEED